MEFIYLKKNLIKVVCTYIASKYDFCSFFLRGGEREGREGGRVGGGDRDNWLAEVYFLK